MAQEEVQPEPTKTAVQPESPKPKGSSFKVFFAILLLIFALALVGGGYFLGKNNFFQKSAQVSPTPSVSTSPTTAPTISVSASPSASPSKAPSKTPSKSVEAGQAGAWVFIPYRIAVPMDWTVDHQSAKDVFDDLTITRGAYKIRIKQAGGEGLKCLYAGEPPEQFSQSYKTYVEFQSLDEQWRRSGETGGTGWTLCHKTPNGWQFPSFYGYISYATPANANPDILKEMDSILSTITKQ